MASYTYFEIDECPLADECTQAHFANAKCWGHTQAEARDRVMAHLLGSGLHQAYRRKRKDYEKLVEGCTVKEKDWPTEPAPKARRHAQPYSDKREAPKGAGVPRSPPQAVDQAPAQQPIAASSQSVTLLRPSPKACSMPPQEYKTIIDACARACQAAKHAQRLSAAAANMFAEEAMVFKDVQNFMEAKLAFTRPEEVMDGAPRR